MYVETVILFFVRALNRKLSVAASTTGKFKLHVSLVGSYWFVIIALNGYLPPLFASIFAYRWRQQQQRYFDQRVIVGEGCVHLL